MKSKWKKRFLVVGSILIGSALIAGLFFGRGHDFGSQFKQPFQNVMTPIMQQGDNAVGQFQQKFRGGPGHDDPAVITRGHDGQSMNHFAPHNGGREHGHHGWFGFGIGSLLTLAFWGGLIALAVTWWKKRQSGRIGQNVILNAATATLALPNQTNTNAEFLDQWEKEQHQLKEDK